MKHLARIAAILCLPCLLGSCALLGKMLQGPGRLLQSAGRTLSDAQDTSQDPASLKAPPTAAVALRVQSAD